MPSNLSQNDAYNEKATIIISDIRKKTRLFHTVTVISMPNNFLISFFVLKYMPLI